MLRVLLGVNLPVHPPESTNESNKNASCGETDTSSQRQWQQHIKITLCKTTFIKTLTDIIACLTYGAIKRSLPHSIFGPFSWLNHQFRICQTSLCRLRASPWFHLLCINKRALATVSPHTTKSFVPLHSKFCSFEFSEKKKKNATQQQHGLVAMHRLRAVAQGSALEFGLTWSTPGELHLGTIRHGLPVPFTYTSVLSPDCCSTPRVVCSLQAHRLPYSSMSGAAATLSNKRQIYYECW